MACWYVGEIKYNLFVVFCIKSTKEKSKFFHKQKVRKFHETFTARKHRKEKIFTKKTQVSLL